MPQCKTTASSHQMKVRLEILKSFNTVNLSLIGAVFPEDGE